MIDATKYLGLSYDINNEFGVNCWGLYKLIKKQEQDIDVSTFTVVNSSVRAISDKFTAELKLGRHGHRQVKIPKPFDLVVLVKPMRVGAVYHCGVYLGNKQIIHAKGEGQSGQVWIEDLKAFDDYRVEYWRHV